MDDLRSRHVARDAAMRVLWVLSGVATLVLSVLAIRGWGSAIDFQWAGSGRRAVELLRNEDALDDARDGLRYSAWLPLAYSAFAVTTAYVAWPRVTRAERWVPGEEGPDRSTRKRWLTAGVVAAVLVAAGLDWYEDLRTDDILDAVEAEPLDEESPPALDAPAAEDAIDQAAARGRDVDDAANRVLVAAVVKWTLLAGAVGWGTYLLRQPLMPPPGRGRADVRAAVSAPHRVAEGLPAAERWRPPSKGEPPRVGISCSGGGVRSAAFCLGALQRLDVPPPTGDGDGGEAVPELSVLRRAEYLTAVSGGSYLASALAVAEWSGTWPEYGERGAYARRGGADEPIDPADPAFAPGSPEESWFRRNSAYLASDASEAAAGVMHTLAGLAVNLIILWLLLFVFTRPLGWLLSSGAVHPELRAREPSVYIVDQPTLGAGRDEATQVLGAEQVDDGTWEFTFQVVPCDRCVGQVEVWRPTLGTESTKETREIHLDPDPARPGVGRVEDGQITILRQPRLIVRADDQIVPEVDATTNDARPTIEINRQPRVSAVGGVATQPESTIDERIQASLRVTTRPNIRQYSGTTGRPPVDIDGRDVVYGFALLGASLALYVVKTFHDPPGVVGPRRWAYPWTGFYSGAIAATGFAGIVMLLVFLVLPWCVQEVPPWVSSTFGRSPLAEPVAGTETGGSTAIVGFLGALGLSLSSIALTVTRKVTSKPMLLAKVFAVVLLLGVGFVTSVSLIQMAAANGPTGRLTGIGLGPTVTFLPDYLKWLLALALLGVMTFGDAHSWSLFPYYRRRLSRAFVVHRRGGGAAEPLPYEIPVHFDRSVGAGAPAPGPEVSPHARARPAPVEGGDEVGTAWRGPELVVCAAANIIDEGVAPPGRRAVSFTFSGSTVGGPEVGWMATGDYLGHLSARRQRDITIPAAMAVSGAAVSPAMGKMGLGPLGRLLAVLNVRLGVWLPNPNWVQQMEADERWHGRPGWPWYLREVLGRHKADARYLYVSDGGHWENLGLVELFRRGCTEIYCLSAAGDGSASFGTLGEAIALAREELGVEIDVELEPLRAGTGSPAAPPGAPLPVAFGPEDPEGADAGQGAPPPQGAIARVRRTLRRKVGKAVEAVPTAPMAFARGTFTYPARAGRPAVQGTLYVLEANLTDDIPWDVQAHAEKWPAFPDDSTADQLFSHRQFESYRRLGFHQADRLLAGPAEAGA